MQLEDYFNFLASDDIRLKNSRIGIETILYEYLEYKYNFSSIEQYNHPFIVTNFIICWDMSMPANEEQIEDAYDYFGYVSLTDELKDIGYEIVNIQSRSGEIHNATIKVISLKKLLNKTFDCEWITPPTSGKSS